MLPTTWEDDPEITKAFVMAPSTELAWLALRPPSPFSDKDVISFNSAINNGMSWLVAPLLLDAWP